MATSATTVDYILDQLRELGTRVRVRKMFGEYALYCDDKVVALICDDQLFVKITEKGKELVGNDYQEGNAYPGAKPAMLMDDAILNDSPKLCKLVIATASQLPVSKKRQGQTASK